MKVVLLQNVKNVGKKGEVKEVSEGYARNSLIPQGLARAGTQDAIKQVQKLSQDKEKHKTAVENKLKKSFEEISGKKFIFKLNTNETGALFAKFDTKYLIQELHKQGFTNITEKHITMSENPIKQTGEYTAVLKQDSITSNFLFSIIN